MLFLFLQKDNSIPRTSLSNLSCLSGHFVLSHFSGLSWVIFRLYASFPVANIQYAHLHCGIHRAQRSTAAKADQ